MEGVRIVEVAQYTFVPAAGAVMADWGADVIKVEPARTGDGQRGLLQIGPVALPADENPAIEHPNRGKRSIGLDLATPEGREVLLRLVDDADVFLTNYRPSARAELGIDVADLRARNPRIIYARGSAFGAEGPDRDKGGYDMTGFWCRGASAASITPDGTVGVIPQPPAYGDTMGGMTIAGGIAAALFARERTGEAAELDVSLLSAGMWAMALPIAATLQNGEPWVAPPVGLNAAPTNPLAGIFATADERYLSLLGLQGFRYWADLCAHVGRPELADDPRFADAESLRANAPAATAILREVFVTRTLAEWTSAFATLECPWAPVQNTLEVAADPQARANGYLATVRRDDGSTYELVASPVRFDRGSEELRPAPAFAADTDAILAELGYDEDAMIELKIAGAVT